MSEVAKLQERNRTLGEQLRNVRRELNLARAHNRKLTDRLRRVIATEEDKTPAPDKGDSDQRTMARLGSHLTSIMEQHPHFELRRTKGEKGDLFFFVVADQYPPVSTGSLVDAMAQAAGEQKWCAACQSFRPAAAFTSNAARADGRNSRCRLHGNGGEK